MEKLSSLGYYCIAPNMRGYSKNACPKGVKHYGIKNLREDILGIVETTGKNRFHLVGHDWGAAVGWNTVFNYPDRIKSWSALSMPHSSAFRKAFKSDKSQRKKISYMKLFLLPYLPEMMIRRQNFKKFRQLWKQSDVEEIKNYLAVFQNKNSLTAALNYYRANIGRGMNESIGKIDTPTLFIWGRKDMAIGSVAAENNKAYMNGDYQYLPLDGGHWLIQSNYEEVEAAIVEHISKYNPS